MNILVTGGAGYIGAELIQSLSKRSDVDKIIVYDNLSRGNYNFFIFSKLDSKKIKFVHADLLDSRKLRQNLKGIDVVYHLAANVNSQIDNIDSHFFEQVNHWGTAELVYAVEESQVKKFVYLSSTAVYGGGRKSMNELDEANPRTFYGISKMRGEDHVKRLMEKINTVIFRCGNVYGYSPSIRFEGVMNRFLFDANFVNRISIHGNGRQSRPFIHINNVTEVLSGYLDVNIPVGIYNLVHKNLQILDTVEVLKEIYPSLEFIFVNQHLAMRDIKIDQPEKLFQYIPFFARDLKTELEEFKAQLAF
ncbi:MAG: SDR family oxidoreductase [Cytophagales bacterium]|nr:SDR family oxidoreductase [Cytophagales bacterium]